MVDTLISEFQQDSLGTICDNTSVEEGNAFTGGLLFKSVPLHLQWLVL
jgi:hypothetical protein